MSKLYIQNINKTYDNGYKAIHNINIQIENGEFVVLVGPSGCGKSTLLRMIAGLEAISEGEILIDDQVVNHVEPSKRNIAMVFQNYALYPHMSIFDNMAYGLKIAKIAKEDIKKRVEDIATILGLSEVLHRKPKQLSGGQRQRVAMGRAIVRDPKVFLFDEPLSNLDAKLRAQMRIEIKKLHRRLKTTSVYVTHDQVEAMTLADKIVILNKGNIEQIGTPQQIFDNPASVFVAQFIGSPHMNLFSVQVSAQGEIYFNDKKIENLSYEAPPAAKNKQMLIGIRPEHLIEHHDGIELDIDFIETLGSEILINLTRANKTYIMRCQPHLISTKLHQGQSIKLWHAPKQSLYWFDPETGKCL